MPEANELFLYAVNDGNFYENRVVPVINNLKKKKARGTYDENRAQKAFYNLAVEAAQHYRREHAGIAVKWYELFPVPARWEAAREMLSHYHELIHDGVEA